MHGRNAKACRFIKTAQVVVQRLKVGAGRPIGEIDREHAQIENMIDGESRMDYEYC